MIFVDSSAWIAYFNQSGDPVAARLDEALASDERVCLSNIVVT